jgi:hemerythrin-like domain-containing protein
MMERRPTEMLEEEHHLIQKVVSAMAVFAEQLESGGNPHPEAFSNIVEFMRTYADKCHHGKEETHLFPLLEKKGVPVRGCPLGILIAEHQRGRTLVSGLAAAAEAYAKQGPSAKKNLLDNLRGLMDLYPNHIWKEEYLLFPMTNKILNSEEQRELQEKFETVEKDIGSDVHHRLEELAERLGKRIQ